MTKLSKLTDFEGLGEGALIASEPEPLKSEPAINREAWLGAMLGELVEHFKGASYVVPSNVRMSVGFTSRGAKGKAIGECWSGQSSADGAIEIFIRPSIADPVEVGAILTHELVHATVGNEHGHGKVFKACAIAVGLEGKMRATVASENLKTVLVRIVDKIGPLPHAALSDGQSSAPKKQVNRQVKVTCEECGYIARAAKQWLETVGPPHCPDHGPMTIC